MLAVLFLGIMRKVMRKNINTTLFLELQGQELHKKLTDESRRADTLDFEMKKFQEKYDTLLKEKEVDRHIHLHVLINVAKPCDNCVLCVIHQRISIERDTLRETNEELRCNQAQQDQLLLAGMFVDTIPGDGAMCC